MSSGPISWFSKKQAIVTLSTAEAEYVALSIATQETVWIRRLLSDLTVTQGQATVLMEELYVLPKILCYMRGPNTSMSAIIV